MLGLGWHLPSISGTPLQFALKPNETRELMLTLSTREDYDWGQKTIVLDLAVGGRHAYLWRGLTALRPAEMAMSAQVVTAKRPRVTAAVAPLTWHGGEHPASDAPRDVRLAVDGKDLARVANAGATWDVPVTPSPSPGALQPIAASLRWRTGAAQRELPVKLYAGLSSAKLPKIPGAVGGVAVYNPSDSPAQNAPVDVSPGDKAAAWHLRDLSGSRVPGVTPGPGDFTALVSVPARSSALFYLCQGPAPGTSDLRVEQRELGTGHGTLTVRNSVHSLTWSEAAGGTLTSWRELATGRELAAPNCGGIAYGQWGKFDPHKPAIGSLDFVGQEKRVLQSGAPGRVEVEVLPAGVEVRVEWKDAVAEAAQVYDCLAYNGSLTYHSQASLTKPEPDTELVVADFHLRRNGWTKLFPDFTGIQSNADGQGGFDGKQPHAGWRQSPYIPPMASLLSPPGFAGSLSVLFEAGTGVDRYRQGFWPAKRPVPGPVDFARVEYANTRGTAAAVTLRLLLHDGHQPAAEAYRRARDEEPLTAEVLDNVTWDGTAALPPAQPADWWHPAWHARVKLAIGPLPEDASDAVVSVDTSLQQRLAAPLDPGSLRLLLDGALVATAFDVTDSRLRFVLPGLRPKGATHQAEVYFDDQPHGPKLRLAATRPMPGLALTDPGFENGGEGWGLPCGVVDDQAHAGKRSALLERREGDPATLLWTASPRVEPNSHYRVTCWARTTSAGAVVRSNLFDGATYDFGQVGLPVPPDGHWHQLSADLPAGSFPATAHPYLRFWLLGPAAKVWLDDVTFERLDGAAAAAVPAVVAE
ncbi:MAG: hypothetical protein HYU66_27690 [Armatimonadetes bacterium]|nr:hypothetical protein [Armatimonadota bacterium]